VADKRDPWLEEDFRVLTPDAFDFVLANELKRAVRSQNFLTLLLVQPRLGEPETGSADPEILQQVGRLISREVRETDLLSHTGTSELSVVLLDADLPNSLGVVDRVMSRLQHYQFSQPLDIDVGAASCPTDGADPESLRVSAQARRVHPRDHPGSRGSDPLSGWNKSNAQ
jgi:hypothetical protein